MPVDEPRASGNGVEPDRRDLLRRAGLAGAGILSGVGLTATTGSVAHADPQIDGDQTMVTSTYDPDGFAQQIAGFGDQPIYLLSTVREAAGRDLSAFDLVLVNGWSTATGTAPARYRRVGADPGHDGAFQDSTGVWFEISEPVLRPEMFGAAAITDFTQPADSTAALARWSSAMEASGRPSRLGGVYRTTRPLAFDTGRVTLQGEDSMESGFLFDGCDGMTLTQSNEYDSFLVENLVLITNAANLHTGFRYQGASNHGDAAFRTLRLITSIGLDRYLYRKGLGSGSARTFQHGWLLDFDVEQGDQLSCFSCRAEGAERDRFDGFPDDSVGFRVNNSTQFQLHDSSVYFKRTGVRLRTQSESLVVSGGLYVANWQGIDMRSDVRPANGHVVTGTHISSYRYNINLNSGGGEVTRLHKISDCLLFKRPDNPQTEFVHIRDDSQQTTVSGTTFWHGGALDPVAAGDVAVSVGSRCRSNQYVNCTFVNQNKILAIASGAQDIGLVAPIVDDPDPARHKIRPVDDHGDGTVLTLGAQGGRKWGNIGSVLLLTKTRAQAIARTRPTALNWSRAETDDFGDYWSTGSPAEIAVGVTGRYRIRGSLVWQANPAGTRHVEIGVNDGKPQTTRVENTVTALPTGESILPLQSGTLSLKAGDRIKVNVAFTSEAQRLDVVAGSWIEIERV